MQTLVVDRTTHAPVTAINPWLEYQAGYDAYMTGHGPGVGLLRTVGWLAASHAVRAEAALLAEQRTDANDSHYRWQF